MRSSNVSAARVSLGARMFWALLWLASLGGATLAGYRSGVSQGALEEGRRSEKANEKRLDGIEERIDAFAVVEGRLASFVNLLAERPVASCSPVAGSSVPSGAVASAEGSRADGARSATNEAPAIDSERFERQGRDFVDAAVRRGQWSSDDRENLQTMLAQSDARSRAVVLDYLLKKIDSKALATGDLEGPPF